MNNFQGIQSGQGILKANYDNEGNNTQLEALRRRRNNLTDKITTPTKDKLEGNEEEPKDGY